MRLIDADALVSEIERRRKAAKTLTGLDMVWLTKVMPTVEAVPLDKLCEWLSDNAYMYLTEKELDSGYSSHDPAYWEMKLSKWMEEQNAAD